MTFQVSLYTSSNRITYYIFIEQNITHRVEYNLPPQICPPDALENTYRTPRKQGLGQFTLKSIKLKETEIERGGVCRITLTKLISPT